MARKGYSLEDNSQKYEQVTYYGSSVELVPGENSPRKRRRQLLIIAVVVVLALALIVGLAVGLSKKGKDADDKTGDTKGFKEATTTTKPTQGDWLDQPCFNSNDAPECPWTGVNPVVLISFSGLDVDYLRKHSFPLLDKLRRCGVHAPYMRPVYPTTMVVNQYALVTGLYPAFSGVTDDRMYDPALNKTFEEKNERRNPAWWGGEPLWATVKKYGKKSASSAWVANSVNISGVAQDFVQEYNQSVTFEEQVDKVLDWLKLDESSRPDFITVYFGNPDYQDHDLGPDNPEMAEKRSKTINAVHQLMNGLYRNGLENCVNVIITSDPGMSETTCERRVVLDYYLPKVDDMLVYAGTRGVIQGNYSVVNETIIVRNDIGLTAQEITDSLECKNVHLDMFSDATMPVRLHYSHPRIGPVIMRVDDRWVVKHTKTTTCMRSNNGYDNIYQSMQAVFFAHGPGFKQNFIAEPFDSIELYNVMAGLLKVKPAQNNGTAGSLSYILEEMPDLPDLVPSFDPAACGVTTINRTTGCSCGTEVQPKLSDNSNNKAFLFGVPAVEYNTSMCRINSKLFTVLYDRLNKQPSLASFTLTAEQVEQYNSTTSTCIYPDSRLSDEDNPDCTMYENAAASIVHTQLFDPGFATTSEDAVEAHISSNMVPMYTGFKDGIWYYLWRVIKEYAMAYQNVHVSVGPVFDRNFDGRVDETVIEQMYVKSASSVPLPSHYFAILMKCAQTVEDLSQCQTADLQTLAFVLPHINKTTNCMPNKDYLKDNVVRIRDIEVLTGLRFLTGLDRLVGARKRTVLETELWPSPVLTPWVDLPCPIPDHTQCQPGKNPLLLISLDGFRADYFYRHLTPVIQRLADCGVHTPYMRSVYPTVTFPNHYTIVTGLYPESHGIIGNNMYDEEIDKIFSLSAPTAKDPRWWKGEPIWNTAMKQGLKTATYFWPGSDVNISGMYPDIYKPYDGKAGYTSRVMEVLDWLTMPPEERPDFITLYFDEPDHAGHNSGPVSDEVDGQLETVDKLINILMTNLYEKGLHNCLNIIILADHGMSDQSCDKMVMLKDFLPDVGNMLVFDRTMANIFPEFKADNRSDAHRQNITDPVETIVANLTCRHSAMKAFTKTTLPRRHHFTNSPRIGDVMVDMKDEWIVMRQYTSWCTGGNHGWDNTYKNMHALFLAHGPAFKTNYTTEPFENIELYNLMTEILNITAASNNGTQGTLSHVLRNPNDVPKKPQRTPISCDPSNETLFSTCGCQVNHNISEAAFKGAGDVLVFGMPAYTTNNSLCLLHQPGSTAAFSSTLNSPVWLTTLVTDKTSMSLTSKSTCVIRDTRVSHWETAECANETNDKIEMTSLIDLGILVDAEMAHLTSLMVPMYRGFKSGIWKVVKDLIQDYTKLYGNISVTSGPLYDYNNDGLPDDFMLRYVSFKAAKPFPVPTHIFVSLIKCRTRGEALPCIGAVDILSFILPHSEEIFNCLSPADYLKDNVARLRDIELMSGVQFMTSYNTTYAARLRTYLPEALWKSTLFKEWKDLPCPQQSECNSDYRPLLLVSLDGFRADYLLRNVTPVIERLSQCGVSAPYMRSVYPTKTFPNHYSIVTGLYPESHGIIDNNMYDLGMEKRFSLGSAASKDPRWWGGEPIWLTAKKQGKKAATYFWPGSDVKIQAEYPDYWRNYNGKIPYYERVLQVLDWMTLPKGERPDFITLYFDEPDLAGHKYGPDGDRILKSLERVDDIIGLLMDGLMERNLHHCVNLVIVADHGMAEVDCDRLVRLKNYVDYGYLSANTWVWEGPFGRIANRYIYNRSSENQISPAVNPASTDGIFANLTCANPHLDLFKKSTLPVRHHYSNNDRIDDIIVDPDSDWLFTRSFARACSGGNHGYDNIEKSMQALFLAYGPAFKWNLTVDAFENIELYNMFTELLNITAAPNNGTMGSLSHILQNPVSYTDPQLFVNHINGTLQYANQMDYLTYVQSAQCADLCKNIGSEKITGLYDKVTSMVGHDSAITDLPKLKQREHNDSSVTILQHTDFVIGYDEDVGTSLWIKHRISNTTKARPSPVNCLIPDPRISNYKACSNKSDSQFSSLLLLVESPQQFEYLSTLYSRMKQKFATAIWVPLQELVQEWLVKYGSLEVISGPVYDHNHDSLPDDPLDVRENSEPSHFYVIISRCLDHTNVRCTNYKTFSTILPHVGELLNCKTFEAFLAHNECRIRDIELITGLQFYTELPDEESIKLRTYLPDGLWP